MEKEILNQLLNQFSDFKKYQFILLVVAFLVFIIISILQTVYTSRLVDKYRNQLKKNELRFSVLNELQIKKLSYLFELASALKSGSARIYNELESDNKQIDTTKWNKCYDEFNEFFSSNKYIIPKEMKLLISESIKDIIEFNFNINMLGEKLDINSDTNISIDERNEYIELIEKETKDYNYHNKVLNIMIFSEKLKSLIELYFEKFE